MAEERILEAPGAPQALRWRGRRGRDRHRGARRRSALHHRAERGRKVHVLSVALRHLPARPRAGRLSRAGHHPHAGLSPGPAGTRHDLPAQPRVPRLEGSPESGCADECSLRHLGRGGQAALPGCARGLRSRARTTRSRRASFPTTSSSGWRSRWCSHRAPACCCSTSRPPGCRPKRPGRPRRPAPPERRRAHDRDRRARYRLRARDRSTGHRPAPGEDLRRGDGGRHYRARRRAPDLSGPGLSGARRVAHRYQSALRICRGRRASGRRRHRELRRGRRRSGAQRSGQDHPHEDVDRTVAGARRQDHLPRRGRDPLRRRQTGPARDRVRAAGTRHFSPHDGSRQSAHGRQDQRKNALARLRSDVRLLPIPQGTPGPARRVR